MRSGSKSAKARPRKSLLTAAEACKLLGVKPATLYAYVSRGLLLSEPSPDGRGSLYPRSDVETLRARSRARAGHGPVAAGALRWGEPVLESGITTIHDGMLYYRGYALADLLARDIAFENVAELLWSGDLPLGSVLWDASRLPASRATLTFKEVDGAAEASLPRRLFLLISECGLADPVENEELMDQTLRRARSVLQLTAATLFGPVAGSDKHGGVSRSARLAEVIAAGSGCAGMPEAIQAVDMALIASADHELNASTFATRVAASTAADYYACLLSGLAAFSGRRHGMAPLQLGPLLERLRRPNEARDLVRGLLRQKVTVPGFGHQLYPAGDPRGLVLVETARVLAQRRGGETAKRQGGLDAYVEAADAAGVPSPSLDLGLYAVASALDLPAEGAVGLFALGRMAGWTAHVLEQRQQDFMLRPRARYVGRAPVRF